MTSIRTASGPEGSHLAEAQIAAGLTRPCGFRSVKEALHQPEHVGGSKDHAERGGDGPAAADAGERAGEDQKFANEAVQHGQADHGERGDHKERGECEEASRPAPP